jgi:hypothetical protein
MSGCSSRIMSRAPRLLVMKIKLFSKLIVEPSPSRSDALSRTPSSSVDSDGAAFSISSNRMRDSFERSLVACCSFCCVRIGWLSR